MQFLQIVQFNLLMTATRAAKAVAAAGPQPWARRIYLVRCPSPWRSSLPVLTCTRCVSPWTSADRRCGYTGTFFACGVDGTIGPVQHEDNYMPVDVERHDVHRHADGLSTHPRGATAPTAPHPWLRHWYHQTLESYIPCSNHFVNSGDATNVTYDTNGTPRIGPLVGLSRYFSCTSCILDTYDLRCRSLCYSFAWTCYRWPKNVWRHYTNS